MDRYSSRDLHAAPKVDLVKKISVDNTDFALLRQQWGKEDVGYSLHIAPRTWTTMGIQEPDFLTLLGFTHSACVILGGECFAKSIAESFDLDGFASAYRESFRLLKEASGHFERCGMRLEGNDDYENRLVRRGVRTYHYGDGHTASKIEQMKKSEDENYTFIFTWIEGVEQKGWTTHYRPKNIPISQEIKNVLGFIGLKSFAECPQFDFEECHWRFTPFQSESDFAFDSNASQAHSYFDSHAANFSNGIEKLIKSHTLIEPFEMGYLPLERTLTDRTRQDIVRNIQSPKTDTAHEMSAKGLFEFEVALSFADSERGLAESLANKLKAAGINVFYDDFYPAQLWGKDLVEFFDGIYRKKSRYCVMFISNEYASRLWTIHERKSAQARMLQEKGGEYILPIRVDDTELPGMPGTVGYLSAKEYPIDKIAEILVTKLKK